jgi:hypothetical protein
LRKHYGLSSYTPQSNSFVLFEEYWNQHAHPTSRGVSRPGRPRASTDPPEAAATSHGARPKPQLDAAGTLARPRCGADVFGSSEGHETRLQSQRDLGPPVLSQSNLEHTCVETLGTQQAKPPLPTVLSSRSCAFAEARSTRHPEHDSLTALLQLQQSSLPPPQSPPPRELIALQPNYLSRQAVVPAQQHGPLSCQTTTQQPAAIPAPLPPQPQWCTHPPNLPPQRHWCTHAAATGPLLQGNPSGGPLSRAYQDKHGFAGRSVSRLRDQVAMAAVPQEAGVGSHLHPQYGLNTSVGGSLCADVGRIASVPLGTHAPNYGTGAGMPSCRQPALVPHQMVRLISRPY